MSPPQEGLPTTPLPCLPVCLVTVSMGGVMPFVHFPSQKVGILYVVCMRAKSLQSCSTLCDPMDYSPPGSPVLGILQAKEYWSGLPCPPPGDLPDLGLKPLSLMSPAMASGLFTTSATWEAHFIYNSAYISIQISKFFPPSLPPTPVSLLVTISLFSTSVILFLSCKYIHLYHCLFVCLFRFHL